MSRGTIVPVLVALSMVTGCSKKSPYGKTDPQAQAAESAAAARAGQAAGSASADPDAGIADPDLLIERGWSRHLQGQNAQATFARAMGILRVTYPSVPPGSMKGAGLLEGVATRSDGTMAVAKTSGGLLFYRPDSGTVTGWRRLTGSLAQPGGLALHPVRPLVAVALMNPPKIHIIDTHTMADLPVPAVDEGFIPSVSPSGTRIAYLAGNALHLLDVDSGKDRYAALPQPEGTVPGAVLFPADTKSFAVLDVVSTPRGAVNSQVRLVNAADGRVLFTQKIEKAYDGGAVPPSEAPPAMDFSADGSSFRFVDPTNGKLMAVDRTSGAAKPEAGQPPSSAPPRPPTEVAVLTRTVCHLYGRVMPASACADPAAPASSGKP